MPTKPQLIEAACKLEQGSKAEQESQDKSAQAPLRTIVREALLSVLKDQEASAAAKASAGRTLLQYFDNDNNGLSQRRGADMTAAELDAAIQLLDK